MANTISYLSYNQSRNLTESLPIQYETEPDTYKVSEMDSQTAGKNLQYQVSPEVVAQVHEIQLKEQISNTTKSVVSYRMLALNQ